MSILYMSGIQIMGVCPIFKGLVSKWSGNLLIKVTLHSIRMFGIQILSVEGMK